MARYTAVLGVTKMHVLRVYPVSVALRYRCRFGKKKCGLAVEKCPPMSRTLTLSTVFGSHGRARTEEFGPGDVGYVPQGYGHYIECVGTEEVEAVLALNNGTYE